MAEGQRDAHNDVLIVVPTLNEEKHIAGCITSLLGTREDMQHTDLIVADGGSTDQTRAIVAQLAKTYPSVRLLHNPDRLQSSALNLAVADCATATHRYIVRCDAHAIYPDDYVADVVSALRDKDAASVATVMDAKAKGCFSKGAAWIVDTKVGSGGSAHRGGTTSQYVNHGHHAGMRLDWFRKIGGYDPDFVTNEDAEYDVRLTQAGGKIWLAADIRMQYLMRPSPKALLRQYFRYGRGRAQTVVKHRIKPQLRQLIPVINLILLGLSIPLALLSPLGIVWPAAYLLLLVGASLWITLKHRSLCGLWAGPALAIIHLSWGVGFVSMLWRSRRRLLNRAL